MWWPYPSRLACQRPLLLTRVHTGKLRLATPDQADLKQGLWTIPPYIVPLSAMPSSRAEARCTAVATDVDGHVRKPGSTKLLVNALVGIKAQPGWLIVITGHADARGDAVKNLELSRARASAVRDWMQRMGDIPDSCFAVQGVAASQPVRSNDTQKGRAENRRVDIRLVSERSACAELEAAARSLGSDEAA